MVLKHFDVPYCRAAEYEVTNPVESLSNRAIAKLFADVELGILQIM